MTSPSTSDAPWVEVIRGLGLGGAETLLQLRLSGTTVPVRRTTLVINTAASQAHFRDTITASGVPVTEFGGRSVWRGISELVAAARQSPPDCVLVVHSPVPALWLKLARMVRLFRRPLIQVVHSGVYKTPHVLVGRLTNWLADGAVAVSKEVATSASARGFTRTLVVHGGVDVHGMADFVRSHPNLSAELRARFGVPTDAPLVGAVGTLFARKGHADLVRALAAPECADTHLLLVGDGPESNNLRALVAELGLADRVRFAGRVSNAWQLLAGCDALCHTSRAEGLPVVLMEALALGLPVVATAFSGATEAAAISSGITIVPLGDVAAITTALSRVSRRGTKSIHGDDYWAVERFNRDFTAAVDRLAGQPPGETGRV